MKEVMKATRCPFPEIDFSYLTTSFYKFLINIKKSPI